MTVTGLPPANVAVYAKLPGTVVSPLVAEASRMPLSDAPYVIAPDGAVQLIVGVIGAAATGIVVVLLLAPNDPLTPA